MECDEVKRHGVFRPKIEFYTQSTKRRPFRQPALKIMKEGQNMTEAPILIS